MIRRTRLPLLAAFALAAVAALAVAGCGSNGNGNATATPTTPKTTTPKTTSGPAATVGVATTDLGKILVDSAGRTVYLFESDTSKTSTCTGGCATAWPPVTATGTPTAGSGATASLIGAIMRSDGSQQVTYHGHPLYRFNGDQKAGDTKGQALSAFGAEWYVLSPSGNEITAAPSSSSSGSGTSGY